MRVNTLHYEVTVLPNYDKTGWWFEIKDRDKDFKTVYVSNQKELRNTEKDAHEYAEAIIRLHEKAGGFEAVNKKRYASNR